MKLTLSWLKQHLETSADLPALVQGLTMLGLEVDEVVDRGAALAPFRVARIVSAEPHPNADKLRVCRVDIGGETVQVVCGAPNARAGLVTAFAPVGATIPRNGMVLKPSRIRDVASNGMLCSGYELGLTEDHEGILDLPADLTPGTGFAQALGLDDPLLDVKVTPNRADCLSLRGIARDLAAGGFGRLKPLDIEPVPGAFASPVTVKLDEAEAGSCPLFIGRWFRGLRNGPSPRWLQDRLTGIGLRPISALVDLTNYLTFDLNRPLHVFDGKKLQGDLSVRSARAGETLEALNGKSYELAEGMTVVADAAGPLALGGVMGGVPSGCTGETTEVFLEAALFDPVRTAATGRRLNVQSDARYRFERGAADPAFVRDGIELATRLILDLCGGEASELVIAGSVPPAAPPISFRPARVAALGGVPVGAGDCIRFLTAIGCEVEVEGAGEVETLAVVRPSWRPDIEGEADLVEEVLRLNGYDRIPIVPLSLEGALPRQAVTAAQRRNALVRRVLATRGLDEAVTYSFMSSELLDAPGRTLFGPAEPSLRLANPISSELDIMRPTILPNLLTAAKRNADRGFGDVALFELGPQYRDDTPEGESWLASGVRIGRTGRKHWREAGRGVDAFDAKADAIAALAAAGAPVENLQVTADAPSYYHPGRSGTLRLGPKAVLAYFGELHPRVLAALDLKGPAVGFEVRVDAVPQPKATRGRPLLRLSAFQPVDRDFAFIVGDEVTAEQVLRAARGADRKLVTEVRLFDVYAGPGVPEGRKSLALAVTLQPVEATLTDEAIEAVSKSIVANVAKMTGGVLRG